MPRPAQLCRSILCIFAVLPLVQGCAFLNKITGKEAEDAKMEADFDPGADESEKQVFSANAEDFEELSLLARRLEAFEAQPLPSVAELDAAVTALHAEAEAKGVSDGKLQKALAKTMKKGKVNAGSLPRKSRKTMSAALKLVLDSSSGLADVPARVDGLRGESEELRGELLDRCDKVIDRSKTIEESPSREARRQARTELTRARKTQRDARKRLKAVDAQLDEAATRGRALAESLGIDWVGTKIERDEEAKAKKAEDAANAAIEAEAAKAEAEAAKAEAKAEAAKADSKKKSAKKKAD